MQKTYITILTVISLFMSALMTVSCTNKEDEPNYDGKDSIILIYAIAANSLNNALDSDLMEITQIAPSLNLKNNKVVVYSVQKDNKCLFRELTKGKNGYTFETKVEFAETPLSTSQERISDVIEYFTLHYGDYAHKGLILWSHADGWIPWFGGSSPNLNKRKAFGEDQYQGAIYKTNINDLSEAIPEGVFDFIWFDCCYMANIETMYQLKDKTEYIAGYVTEIAAAGMPYNLTMPYLLQDNAKLVQAADELFEYYDSWNTPVSVSVIKTSELQGLADVARQTFTNPVNTASLTNVQQYQTNVNVPFFDMKQLMECYDNSSSLTQSIEKAFENAILYKNISSRNFNNQPIDRENFSGFSMYFYSGDPNSSYNMFYRQLDWFKATRLENM